MLWNVSWGRCHPPSVLGQTVPALDISVGLVASVVRRSVRNPYPVCDASYVEVIVASQTHYTAACP